MAPWIAVAAVGAVWQVSPLVVVEAGNPVLCGYHYTHISGLELRVEKGVRAVANGEPVVFTALDVVGAAAARLQTRSFDSDQLLPPVAAETGRVRREADLQTVDAGGALFAELGVSGGRLQVSLPPLSGSTRDNVAHDAGAQTAAGSEAPGRWITFDLPAPLPRGVTATYLNCAGDLIRPD